MKRILIFEDDVSYANACARSLEEARFEVFHAKDIIEFNEIFSRDKNWDLMVFDAWIDSEMEYTYPFVEWVREELRDQVKLVANSSSRDSNRKLMLYGCDFSSGNNRKFDPGQLPNVVKSLLTTAEV